MPLVAESVMDIPISATPSVDLAPSLERARKPRGGFLSWAYPLACIACMAVLLVMYLCQSARMVGLQYHTVQLKERKAALLREKTDLALEVQELTSLARIEKIATQKLGMVLPTQRLVLDLTENVPQQAYLKDVVAARRMSIP